MKIICIWNGNDFKNNNNQEKPIFYFKPETTLLLNNRPFYFPEYSNDIDCNLQVVLKINKVGKYIQEKYANTYYDEIGLGMSLTARDIQEKCIKEHLPLDISYCFDGSSPLSKFIDKKELNQVSSIKYQVSGQIISKSEDQIINFDRIVSFVSEYMMLKTGDLIFTGNITEAVKIKIGDEFEGFLNGRSLIRLNIK